MSCKLVVGAGPLLDQAMAAWREREPGLDLRRIEVDPDAGRDALAAALDVIEDGASAFVAIDHRHLNFRRLALVEMLRERGIPMMPLIEAGALLAAGVEVGANGWAGPGAIVRHGCVIGENVVLGAGVIVGAGASIAASCWIGDGVVIGGHAGISAHVTLGLGVQVGQGVRIAECCVIDRPGRIEKDIAGRTFVHASHDGPIFIAGQ